MEYLFDTLPEVYEAEEDARYAEHELKHKEAVWSLQGNGPVSLKKESARARDEWRELAAKEAAAQARRIMLKETRDTHRINISLHQTEMRDRR